MLSVFVGFHPQRGNEQLLNNNIRTTRNHGGYRFVSDNSNRVLINYACWSRAPFTTGHEYRKIHDILWLCCKLVGHCITLHSLEDGVYAKTLYKPRQCTRGLT